MKDLIPHEDAVARLRSLCDDAGGVGVLAKKIGVTTSAVSHQLAGNRPIQGKVAKYMGLTICRKTTIAYKKVTT